MEYEEITLELDGSKHIIIDNGDGSFKSFPADLENPEYVAFLKSLEPKLPEVKETPETPEAE